MADVERILTTIGFRDWQAARACLDGLCPNEACRVHLLDCLPMLLNALSETANPDGSLVNFERFVQAAENRKHLFEYLSHNPRAVEILVKLFVGSQFLTEILLRHPVYLENLTRHARLADFKSREDFCSEAHEAIRSYEQIEARLDALRRFQRWELLRIGACDSFGLMDLKSTVVQLSLLADGVVQTCLHELCEEQRMSSESFAVLAFGKLGGEELNYSSDIDLVFVAGRDATRFWPLGQQLINALTKPTVEGFLYRTDMRLRPWGRSGPLVVSADAYRDYVRKDAQLWEKQALLKARVIAGDFSLGQQFLGSVEPYMFGDPVDQVRRSVQEMKTRIEEQLRQKGRAWGEVKAGEGSIRDVEFVTQFLQLAHGARCPQVRSINTLDALVRLADMGIVQADEYRYLSTGYVFLRTVEHSLQLMHNKQAHSLPQDPGELAYLARRLDFAGTDQFLAHYEEHCRQIRRVYERYIEQSEPAQHEPERVIQQDALSVEGMEPSYAEEFSAAEIARHRQLLDQLSQDQIVSVEGVETDDGLYRLTIVGYDQIGDLNMICGLLFVYGFDIVDGNVFTADQVQFLDQPAPDTSPGTRRRVVRQFVNVFTVRAPREIVSDELWQRYQNDLAELMGFLQADERREAQGRLAKRVPMALRQLPDFGDTLYPVDITFDNQTSARCTVLHIQAQDTPGFLYALTNALTLAGINIVRVSVSTTGNRVSDILYVTDEAGQKLIDEVRQQELRSAVVLIKHFTHLLPRSSNPESSLLQFGRFVEQLFQQPNWPEDIAMLERSEVLDGLAKVLGVSTFLWEDFLRLQHSNLFPVVTNIEALQQPKSRSELSAEIAADLEGIADRDERRTRLNAFKDREMFRVDMRHILGLIDEFGQFSAELTDVAEVVIGRACDLCRKELESRYGIPCFPDGEPCPLCVVALGKCGGRELGFASDIELMFLYDGPGRTSGPEVITAAEFFTKLVELFTRTIQTRRKGIFEVDLRLRPYGEAGNLAVSAEAFCSYFMPEGAAWPYERQALVKMRPILGDREFCNSVVKLRDELIYRPAFFDVIAMHAMRERQLHQLVRAGTFNAKLGQGGLVDCEYLVQGLQMIHGHRDASLRTTNTLQALDALQQHGILATEEANELRRGYVFLRRLIDALRMVRGDARDLAVPDVNDEAFIFLARRLGYRDNCTQLERDIQVTSDRIFELGRLLEPPQA